MKKTFYLLVFGIIFVNYILSADAGNVILASTPIRLVKNSSNKKLFDYSFLSNDKIFYDGKTFVRVRDYLNHQNYYNEIEIVFKEYNESGLDALISKVIGNPTHSIGNITGYIINENELNFTISNNTSVYTIINDSKGKLLISSLYLAFANNLSISLVAVGCKIGPRVYSSPVEYRLSPLNGEYAYKSVKILTSNGFIQNNRGHALWAKICFKTLILDESSPLTKNATLVTEVAILP